MENSPFNNNILGRYFCNTLDEALESAKSKPFDVVVIGAGMYGSYIASKLYYWSKERYLGFDRRLKILILEAGPYLIHEHIENFPQNTGGILSSVEKSPYICKVKRGNNEPVYFNEVTKHSYCVGGKSLSWGKWSPRLTDETLKSWPQEVHDFLLNDPDGYKRVEDETGASDISDLIKGTLYNGLKGIFERELAHDNFKSLKLWNTPIAVAAGNTISGVYSPDAFSSLGFLLENVRTESAFSDVGTPPNVKSIFLVPNSFVFKLDTKDGRVSHINLVDANSKEKKVIEISDHCDVILAGTAIESTRLALNSFPRSNALKEGVPELIGRNLMAHLFTDVKVRIKRKVLDFLDKSSLETALFHLQGRSEKFQKDYHFQIFCNADNNFNAFATLYKMFYDLEVAVDTLSRFQDPEWVTLLILSCSETKGEPTKPVYTDGTSWMDLSQREFETMGDLHYYKPYLNWESSQEDEAFWDEVHTTLFDFLESLVNPGDIEYSVPKTSPEWTAERPTPDVFDKFQNIEAFWNSRHEMGTLWMGEDANKSVTDLDGKFHHVQNVYCADHGLFPTAGSANPTLTSLTLNRKVARAILDRYQDIEGITVKDFEKDGFKPLFDGTAKSWDSGWKIQQDKGNYLILFGEILELSKKDNKNIGVAWYNAQEFSKFELNIDWKVFDYDANSGIIIHAPNPANFAEDNDADIYRRGYEIQIDERGYNHYRGLYGSPLHKTGAIYNLSPANRGNAKKAGFWNRFRIISNGEGIKVYLNHKLVSQLDSLDRNRSGYICLQFHTQKIQFRNIMIKEL
jgi:hypothetical protein